MQNETTELSTTNILSLFETNKQQRLSFCENLIKKLEDGDANPLQVHAQIKSIEDLLNTLTSTDKAKNKNLDIAIKYKAMLMNAAEKYGKSFQLFNATYTMKEVGTKYDYSNCGDIELNELMAQAEVLKAKIEARQETLKHLPLSGMLTTDEKTGDTYKIYPPSKKSTTAVSVSLR